ncbi:MAG: hypothetical protein ACLFUB_19175 [Cyclobacteriaceae bacterium]
MKKSKRLVEIMMTQKTAKMQYNSQLNIRKLEILPLPKDAPRSIYHSKKEKFQLLVNGQTYCSGTWAECMFVKLKLEARADLPSDN